MKTTVFVLLTLALGGEVSAAPAPLLLQHPTMSRDAIAFDFAGEIWSVAREGGNARRLVAGQGRNSGPLFSPDGTLVAYTGTYDQNSDVYVAPAAGGQPTRLTYHPGLDMPVGWTPDGKSVLFFSARKTYRDLHEALHRARHRRARRWRSRSLPAKTRPSPPMRRTWPTSRIRSGSRPGSTIAAARRRPSGSPTSATPA